MKRLDVLRAGFFTTVPIVFATIGMKGLARRVVNNGLRWAMRTSLSMEALIYGTAAQAHALAAESEQAIKMPQEAHHRRPLADLNLRTAMIYHKCGDPARARQYYERALVEDITHGTDSDRRFIEAKLRELDDSVSGGN